MIERNEAWQIIHQRLSTALAALERSTSGEVSQDRARAMLEERARVAAERSDDTVQEATLDVLSFQVGPVRMALETCYVHELLGSVETTQLPGRGLPWLGVFNLRGAVLPVIDLGWWWDRQARAQEGGRVVVVGSDEPELGCWVDSLGTVETRGRSEVRAVGDVLGGRHNPKLRGILDQTVHLLDGRVLLEDESLIIEDEPDA